MEGNLMTEEKHGAAEWLRGIVDEAYMNEAYPSCVWFASTFFGIECRKKSTCTSCILSMFKAIADRIEAERALPEGIEWPRFEDGELVKVGDEVGSDEPFTAEEIAFESERWLVKASARSVCGCFHGAFGEPVKRPTLKVLGADDVPIEVGDTVYCDGDDEPLRVKLIHTSGYRSVSLENKSGEHYSLDPERLTHKRPDSWEKLENYIRFSGITAGFAAEIISRAKALAKAGEVE